MGSLKIKTRQHAAFLLCILLLLQIRTVLFPTLAEQKSDAHTFLLQKSTELTKRMDTLAESSYLQNIMPQLGDQGLEMGTYDYRLPNRAMIIKMDPEAIFSALMRDAPDIASLHNLPQDVFAFLMRRAAASLPNILLSSMDVNKYAAATALSVNESYLSPSKDFESTLVCLAYDDSPYASIVTFVLTGDGILSGSSMFVPAQSIEALTMGGSDANGKLPIDLSGLLDITEYTQDEIMALLAE